jgi:hypothetical protein
VTIEKGIDWGRPGPLPADGVVCATDADARRAVVDARRQQRPLPVIGLIGGDLWKTLGGPLGGEHRLRSADAMTFPVDLGSALVDGRLHWFVAHLVARRSWLRGRVVVAMNAQWLGEWDLAPRGHPDDGRLDVTDGDLPLRQRFAARKRLVTGTHLPHPSLEHRRVDAFQTELHPPLDVYLDGDKIGRATNLSVRVEPDALTIVV